MNARIKSLFILPAIIISLLLLAFALYMALRAEADSLAWWGVALAAVPLPVAVIGLRLGKRARASENAPLAIFVACCGVFLAAWEWLFEGVADWIPFALAAGALAVLLLYVFWYSRFGRIASGQLGVGNRLPGFTLTDTDGNPAGSADLQGKPAVLVFYRGNWCSLSMAQITEMVERQPEFERLRASVVLISPQPAARSRELAGRHPVPFHFWVDQGNAVAESLDIAVRGGVPVGVHRDYHADTVMPTVVVANANGTIIYSDQTDNYRVRPEPDIFLALLRRAGANAR